jgi:hypothetical protein
MRQRLLQLPEPERPRLTRHDGLGAIGICLLSFLSTFPIVIPFSSTTRDWRCASNAVAIAMLFVCGFAFGRFVGSTVGNRPFDGRHRFGIGRRCDGTYAVHPSSRFLALNSPLRLRYPSLSATGKKKPICGPTAASRGKCSPKLPHPKSIGRSQARRLRITGGDAVGGLLNATFGNGADHCARRNLGIPIG